MTYTQAIKTRPAVQWRLTVHYPSRDAELVFASRASAERYADDLIGVNRGLLNATLVRETQDADGEWWEDEGYGYMTIFFDARTGYVTHDGVRD